MKMIDTETGYEMVEVSGHDKKEYASKGIAGTGLGLGIAGTALWLLIGEGFVKITIPFMNKTVVFDKDDFNELKTNIENYEKSK